MSDRKIHLCIFASGSGTNAEAILRKFLNHPRIYPALILTNNPEAGVLKIAEEFSVPSYILKKEEIKDENILLKILRENKIDWIALAGYLKLLPTEVIRTYKKRIVNIHPALLPKYGGKGMYGTKVHEAVIANKDKESGLTIHYADEIYDHGKIIFQKKIAVDPNWDAHTLAEKILVHEHENYPVVLEKVIMESFRK